MGFTDVYDYAPGKDDWLAAGLPSEGAKADEPTAGSVARKDPPTCRLDELVADINTRCNDLPCCIVVNEHGIVAGIIRGERLEADAMLRADQVMRPGPSTFRANVPIGEIADYMTKHDLENAPITTPDGKLVGLLLRDEALAEHRGSSA